MNEHDQQRMRLRLHEGGLDTDAIEEIMQSIMKPRSTQERAQAIRWYEARNAIEASHPDVDEDTLDILADEMSNGN
jgi:hypothetical protein